MTKLLCSTLLLLLVALPAHAQVVDWKHLRKWPNLTTSVAATDAGQVLSIAYNQPAGKVIFASTPFYVPPGSRAQGISFEYCGDGSSNYASVVLGSIAWDPSYGYEALFPLNSTDWKKITLGWNSFVQSYLPWDTKAAKDTGAPTLDPSAIAFLNFGWGQYFNRYLPAHASFQIRNVQLVDQVDQPAPPATFSQGWSHTLSLLGSGKPIKILLLGDSITDFGGDHSYGYFLGQKIKATWGNDCTVANCGIGGHTVRGGLIVLPRSLRTMPDPDLVFVLFGANDTKAVGLKPGFGPEVFKTDLEQMIDRVRIATGGNADICLLSGIARLAQPAAGASTGVVEKLAPGIQEAAAARKTAYVDSLASYLQLTPDLKKQYYRDTIHQQPAGLEYLGGLIFTQLQSARNAAPR